jgi:hypothetical protein
MRDGFVLHGAEGALGGALGTLLVKQSLTLGRCLAAGGRDPGEVVLSGIEALRGRPLPEHTRDRVAESVRWIHGGAWGGLLGIAVSALRVKTVRRTIAVGAAMGALAWVVEHARTRPTRPLTSLSLHVLGGVLASLPIALVDRERRRRQPWWERLAEALRPGRRIRVR